MMTRVEQLRMRIEAGMFPNRILEEYNSLVPPEQRINKRVETPEERKARRREQIKISYSFVKTGKMR